MTPFLPHLPDRITVEYIQNLERNAREFQMLIGDDRHALYLPLREGESKLTSDGKLLHEGRVFPGMMRLASPGEKVEGIVYTPSEAIVLHIPGAYLRSKMREVSPDHQPGEVCFVNALLQPKAQVQQLGRLLVQTRRLDPVHTQLFVDGMADGLLAFLLYHHGLAPRASRHVKGFNSKEFARLAEYTDAKMEEALRLEAWAALLDMPVPEFTRRFRETAGASPYAWFMERRIERAKHLLRSSRKSVCEVALTVGFSSQSHFTEAFRLRVGASPARWRQSM